MINPQEEIPGWSERLLVSLRPFWERILSSPSGPPLAASLPAGSLLSCLCLFPESD